MNGNSSKIQQLVGKVGNKISGEVLFFIILMVVSGYMFIQASEFPAVAQIFPQIAAGVVLFSGVAYIGNQFFSDYIDYELSFVENDDSSDENSNLDSEENDTQDMVVTAIMMAVYVIGGYYIGLFWMTPVFVFAYAVYSRQPRWQILVLTLSSIIIAYIFKATLNIQILEGAVA